MRNSALNNPNSLLSLNDKEPQLKAFLQAFTLLFPIGSKSILLLSERFRVTPEALVFLIEIAKGGGFVW